MYYIEMDRIFTKTTESELLSELNQRWGWNIYYDQIESGSFNGVFEFVGSSNAHFYREKYGRKICIHGSVPAHEATFILPGVGADEVKFRSLPVTANTLCAYIPGDEGSLQLPAGLGFMAFCIPRERIGGVLENCHQLPLNKVLSETSAIQIPQSSMEQLRQIVDCMFAASPNTVLDMSKLQYEVEEHLISVLCNALTSFRTVTHYRLALRNHWRYLRKARDFIESHLDKPIGLTTLCQATGVSSRTLEYAFREAFGVGPLNFIKIRRLKASRKALQRGDPANNSIKSVAMQFGFWHLGHFAHDYKKLFGESPSETLRHQRKLIISPNSGQPSTED